MVKRNSGFSPQKDVRRSTRDRSAVYRSLAENNLANQHMNSELMKKILRTANESREQELQETKRLAGYTRSGRKLVGLYNFGSSEDEDDEPTANQRTRSSRNSYPDENDATSSIQKSRSRQVKRRRVALDDELDDEEQNSQDRVIRELEDSKDSCMYDRIKRNRHQNGVFSSTDASRSVSEIATSKRNTARSIRLEKKRIINEDPKDEEDAELVESSGEEGDEEEDNKEPRQYALRKNRNPVERFMFGSVKSERSHPAKFREESDISRRASDKRRERSSKLRGELRRRRMIRSTSSSTDGEDNEERFERRKERTMIDGHDNFLPINLTEKDLSSSQTVIRERLRQIGGPCTNIDPMNIDSNIGFEQVGGLASHIQSLKEIVLFPLIYSDVFKQFNISPPKGIVFYGPPGTGKTLVARALANECGKGGKKVAFFMRKGADCLSKWVGEAERQLRILFEQAYAMRPSIIFFDEIDGLAPVRSSRQDQIHSSIVSTLLALMDGLDNRGEVVVIGATNRLDTLDPALRRPGRFDRELRFSLPDANARLQILKIHTNKWGESKPDTEMLKWLAESTSGYCGADLQYLCAESVLIALRARYPHIYMSNERLALDPNEIKVEKVTFIDAMRKITPASRRDLTIPSRPLDERTCILLLTTIELLLSRIPSGYHCSQSAVNMANTELEKVVRALEQLPCIPAVRLLISGTDNIADNGQTSYILPALLGKLDHLPVFSVSVSRLFSEGRPEEALAHTIQSSLRAASSGPCILLLPSIDQWYNIVPPSVVHMLLSAIDTLNGFTSVLFLSTCDCEYYKLPNEIKEIFRPANSFRLSASQSTDRKKYFEHIIAPTRIPPKEFNASLYIAPEKVLTCDGSVTRKLSQKEAEEVSSKYESQLRQFRIFARDKLGRLMRDRRFNIFNMPVDVEDAQDYYEIIKNPMCLSDIMEKIDRKEYTHPDQFLDDIRLITSNALEYNPNISQEDKTIRHHAIALRDMAEELFDAELEEDFVELLENHAKMLLEANVKPKNEKLLQLPKGFERKTRWTVTNGYMTQVKPELLHKQVKVSVASVDKSLGRARFRTNRKGTYNFPNQQKRKKSAAIVKSIARSLSNSNPTNQLVDFKVDNESCSNVTSHIEDVIIENKTVEQSVRNKETKVKDIDHNQHKENKQLIICDKELQNVIIKCVEYTEGWSIPELERLAAVMTHHIEKFRNHWDRSILPRQLIETVETWENPHKRKYN